MVYISLYRKYRSQTFDEIVGQSHITTTLKNAIAANRISHAYLFSGPRGTGKTSTARIFAKSLNCEKGPTPEPCNACDICDSITRDVLFDVVEIDAASNRGIDDIRELKEKVRVPPSQARYKIYIIDEVHMLTREAFNALLKTLEEPPPNVIFILATTESHKLLATILSRCQRFDFRRIPTAGIKAHLEKIAEKEGFEAEPEALATIAATADGSLRDAISILDQLVSFSGGKVTAEHVADVLGIIPGGEMLSFADALLENNASACFELFDRFFQEGKSVSLFTRLLLDHLRNLFFLHAGMPVELSDPSLKPAFENQAKKIQNTLLVKMLDEAAKVEERVRWENYPRIILEILIIKLIHILHTQEAAPAPRPQQTFAPKQAAAPAPAETRSQPAPLTPHTPPPSPGLPKFDGAPTLEKILAHWPAFLARFKEEALPTYMILNSGAPVSFENGTLTVGFDLDHRFHKDQSQEKTNSERIEKSIEAYFGTKTRYKAAMVETTEPGGAGAEEKQPVRKPPATGGATGSILDLARAEFPDMKQI